jgi:class 3 adenylate cyclase
LPLCEAPDADRSAAAVGAAGGNIAGGALRRVARGGLAALLGTGLALALGRFTALPERLDEAAFDAQVRLARAWRAAPAAAPADADVVLVGIDDGTLDALGMPLAMIQGSLGEALEAIARAGPRAVGVDVALPAHSFDALAPGSDRELMRGLLAVRQRAGLVLALDVDAQGRLRLPPPAMLAVAGGAAAFGLPFFPVDCDGVVRRFEAAPPRAPHGAGCAGARSAAQGMQGQPAAQGSASPGDAPSAASSAAPEPAAFAARLALRAGAAAPSAEAGWIDFTRGAPFDYLALSDVIAWGRQAGAARLRARLGGKVVLVGSVLPFLDRLRLPVPLAAWEPGQTAVPGLVVNAQALRSLLAGGLIRPLGPAWQAPLLLALTSLALLRRGPWRAAAWAFALFVCLAAGAACQASGSFLAPSQCLLAGAAAALARTALDLRAERRERRHLAQRLGAYLSPRVRQAVLRGRASRHGTRRDVALLFADLRDFTSWSESADPALVRETLNRYYEAITPALHAHGGSIDNFRGDGIMVMFGAPEASERPCADAFAAAGALLAAVARFNREQSLAGQRRLEVSLGLSFGEVVFGDLGSAERRDYTALGDAVNVAARLQEMARQSGAVMLMTRDFAQRLPPAVEGIRDLGPQPVRGHSPVEICEWRPAPGGAAAQTV